MLGALLGFALMWLDPIPVFLLAAILYPFTEFAGFVLFWGFAVLLVVPMFAIRGRYPWWMLTPDDPESPFGLYEPAMAIAYYGTGDRATAYLKNIALGAIPPKPTAFRRWYGDVVWLGFRNRFYGLTLWFKPFGLYPKSNGESTLNYKHISGTVTQVRGRQGIVVYTAIAQERDRYRMMKLRFFNWRGRTYGAFLGWKVDSIVEDPSTPRAQINMEGRPIFSPIRVIS